MAIDAPPHLEPPPEAPVPRNSGRGPVALIVVVGLVLVIIGTVAFVAGGSDDTATVSDTPTLHGRPVDPAPARPEFASPAPTASPTTSRPRRAASSLPVLRVRATAPTCARISHGHVHRRPHRLDRVGAKVVFVTTDPGRTHPARLEQWLSTYPVEVVGLRAPVDQLEAAQKAAASPPPSPRPPTPRATTPWPLAAMNVYTPDDLQHLSYGFGTVQSQWMDDIPKIAADPAWNAAGAWPSPTPTPAPAPPDPRPSTSPWSTVAPTTTLTGVSSPDGTGGTLHVTEGTTMKDTETIDLPSGGGVQMVPGGSHVMLSGLTGDVAEGQSVTLVLTFRKAAPLTVTVPVVSFDALAARIGS